MPDIVCLGEPLVEFNRAKDGASYLRGFGGDVSNFAVAAARQGARVAFVGALGDDEHGAAIRRMWDTEGVDHAAVRTDPQASTGIYFVEHTSAGHDFHYMRRDSAASRFAPQDLPVRLVADAKLLHLSGITLAISTFSCDAAYAAVERAREAGARISFDTNLRLRLWPLARASALIRDLVSLCDVCLPSLDDVSRIEDTTDPDALVDRCLRRGARVVALKLGARGALVADAHARHRIPPFPCRPVDATGAGDTFGGAFVARLLAGDDLASAGRYAAAAAALSTEHVGAVAGIPRPERVRALLDAAGRTEGRQ